MFYRNLYSANNAYPDQMPHSMASDLGLQGLPTTLLGVSRLKRVNVDIIRATTDLMTCVPSLDSDQLAYMCSPISLFYHPEETLDLWLAT